MNRRLEPWDLLSRADLDLSRPFSTRYARRRGLDRRQLARLLAAGLLVRPVHGVYHGAHLSDSLALRIACLRQVVPEDAVVTDRTAGWLHGARMILAPGSHLVVPPVQVFQAPGHRLRNGLTDSGERMLRSRDVTEIEGLRVTTPLRTACDLGRLLHRDSAFAALDSMLGLGAFSSSELVAEVGRFRGYRGVRQLRAFAPLADPGSESFGESVLRLRWYDAGSLPRPRTQIVVVSPRGSFASLDLGDPELRYAAEYDGEDFHGPEHREHDVRRRNWLAAEGWTVDVFRREDVFGRAQHAEFTLLHGVELARLRAR
ncbi:MAG: hypothetical protein J7518_17840 [Nocardioidaceae bacterium]|nr:hypothetical protein [Nocardioidaceae bacterium]